jgi:hypothetical protein
MRAGGVSSYLNVSLPDAWWPALSLHRATTPTDARSGPLYDGIGSQVAMPEAESVADTTKSIRWLNHPFASGGRVDSGSPAAATRPA